VEELLMPKVPGSRAVTERTDPLARRAAEDAAVRALERMWRVNYARSEAAEGVTVTHLYGWQPREPKDGADPGAPFSIAELDKAARRLAKRGLFVVIPGGGGRPRRYRLPSAPYRVDGRYNHHRGGAWDFCVVDIRTGDGYMGSGTTYAAREACQRECDELNAAFAAQAEGVGA
jgi:hypothetical protein